MKFDLGAKVFYNTKVENPKGEIILNIGCNVFLEVPYSEAVKRTQLKIEELKLKEDRLQSRISYTRSNLSISSGILKELEKSNN